MSLSLSRVFNILFMIVYIYFIYTYGEGFSSIQKVILLIFWLAVESIYWAIISLGDVRE